MSAATHTQSEHAADVVITCFGAVTSIGLDSRMTVASLRAGLNRFAEQEALRDDTHGDPIVLALQPTLDEALDVQARMVKLALEAAREALVPWREFRKEVALPLLMAVPPPRKGQPDDAGEELASTIAEHLDVRVDWQKSRFFGHGHASGGSALLQAIRLLRESNAPACLVGGVDSPKLLEHLHWLDVMGRLKRPGQTYGLVPGEGAGFLLLCRREFVRRLRWQSLASLQCASQALEPYPLGQQEPTQGQGLTEAFWAVLRSPGGTERRADMTWCDLNGEPWRADEWSFAYLRTGRHHGEPLELWHPADCWGDVGAASVPLLVGAAACELGRKDEQLHATALVWAASDFEPYRSACLLAREGA